MFCVKFVFLVFCSLLKENISFKVKNAKLGRKHTLTSLDDVVMFNQINERIKSEFL
jgi:hypothetical protein